MAGIKQNTDDDTDKTNPASDSEQQRFWKALKPDIPPRPLNNAGQSGSIDVAGDALQSLSSEELLARRDALRSMLAASEARHQGALKSRRPTFAIGQSVMVRTGQYRKQIGTVLDADFIHSRVYLHLDEYDEPIWLEFSHVIAVPDEQTAFRSDPDH